MPRTKSNSQPTTERILKPELLQVSAGLLVGLMVAMAFLLVIGVQRPSSSFELFFNSSVALLGLGLLVFAVGSMAKSAVVHSRFAVLQSVVFILSTVSLSVFILIAANIFFSPAPVQQSPAAAGASAQEAPADQPAQ